MIHKESPVTIEICEAREASDSEARVFSPPQAACVNETDA